MAQPDLTEVKKMLSDMIEKKKVDKAAEEQLRQAKNDGDRNKILENISGDLKKSLEPVLADLAKNSKLSTDDIRQALAEAIQINLPEIKLPEHPAPVVNVPAPVVHVKAPVVNVPAPIVNVPAPIVKMPETMRLTPNDKPFPVMMVDIAGKPMQFPIASGGGGGRGDFFTIVGIQNTILAVNSDPAGVAYSSTNPLPVTITSGASATSASALVDSSGVQYSGSNPLPTTASVSLTLATGQGDGASATRFIQAGDTVSSVIVNSGTITTVTALTSITNTIAANIVDSSGVAYSGTNPLPTTATATLSAAVGQGDGASALRIIQAGDTVSSVIVNSGTITTVTTLTGITNTVGIVQLDRDGNPWQPEVFGQGDSATALRTIQAGDSVSSVIVNSGTITTVTTLTGITNTVGVVQLDRDGNPWQPETFGQGDAATAMRVIVAGNSDASVVVNSGTITTVTTLTGVTNTVNVRLDTPDGIISSANPMPVTLAAGGLDSLFVYQARTTLPTAVGDGADVRPKADKIGRQITRPITARDLVMTAYVTLSTGTEATLLAASAGNFLDLISIIAANTSTAAVQLDIRATTAGNIVQSLYIPANATAGWTPPVPWPQDNQGNNWTVDMGDFTNSNILISALFAKEI